MSYLDMSANEKFVIEMNGGEEKIMEKSKDKDEESNRKNEKTEGLNDENAEKGGVSVLRGLNEGLLLPKSLMTLVLSGTQVESWDELMRIGLKPCVNIKVLVLDRCGLKGTVSFDAGVGTFLDTLVVSHNEIKRIDLDGVEHLKKLSASHNPELKMVENVPKAVAEIRVGQCPKLKSLEFLTRKLKKLALVDLAGSPLVNSWDDVALRLYDASLCSLNMRDTPLRKSYAGASEYKTDCFNHFKGAARLTSLDFVKVTPPPRILSIAVSSRDDVEKQSSTSRKSHHAPSALSEQNEESDAEDFEALLAKKKKKKEQKHNTQKVEEPADVPEIELENNAKTPAAMDKDNEYDDLVVPAVKRVKRKDEGLFSGQSSAW